MEKASSRSTLVFLGLLLVFFFVQTGMGMGEEKILGQDHWVGSVSAKDGKPLKVYAWEKRLKDIENKEYAATGKVVLLLHGATTPGREAFDLQVPEKPELTYSLMDYLAERRFNVFAVDYQNYGRSDKHECGPCVTTQVAANDINSVVDYIGSIRGIKQVYLLGWSWGSTTAGLFTMQHPDKVKRLILFAAPVWRGPRGNPPTTEWRPVTAEGSKRLFEPRATDAIVIDTFAKEVVKFPKAPIGHLMDLNTKMPITDPQKITVPTMMILGSLDKITSMTNPELPGYFINLPNPDKQLIILPGGGHALHMQKPRLRFFTEVTKWFSLE
jgi:pimeloyl-ACP methyl ester carboxylesterase